jgi:hypothetical protein
MMAWRMTSSVTGLTEAISKTPEESKRFFFEKKKQKTSILKSRNEQ